MSIFKKIIIVSDKKNYQLDTKEYSEFKNKLLYKTGTERVIKKLTLKGWKYKIQITKILILSHIETGSFYCFNKWENIETPQNPLILRYVKLNRILN